VGVGGVGFASPSARQGFDCAVTSLSGILTTEASRTCVSTDRPLHARRPWPAGCHVHMNTMLPTCKSGYRCIAWTTKRHPADRARVKFLFPVSFVSFMESKRWPGCTIGRGKPCWGLGFMVMSYGDSQCPCMPHGCLLISSAHSEFHRWCKIS
jgi:hypothetical protein